MDRLPAKPSTDPLRAFLWGKRQSARHPLALDVEVRGTLASVPAMSLDVSASGVLLRVCAAALTPEAAQDGDVDPFVLAETHFRETCLIHFKQRRVKAQVQMVRLDYRPEEPEFLYLGFRFSRGLEPKQLRRLGLRPARCGPEAHGLPSEMVTLRAADDPLVCRVYSNGHAKKPMFEGRLLGVGNKTVCLRVDGIDLAMIAKRLRNAKVRVEVLDGDQVDWETGAHLQAIGLLSEPGYPLELGLVVDTPPGDALRQKFRPPSAA